MIQDKLIRLAALTGRFFRAVFRSLAAFWEKLSPDIHDLHIYGGAGGAFYGIRTMQLEFIIVFGFFLLWGIYGAIRAS